MPALLSDSPQVVIIVCILLGIGWVPRLVGWAIAGWTALVWRIDDLRSAVRHARLAQRVFGWGSRNHRNQELTERASAPVPLDAPGHRSLPRAGDAEPPDPPR